MKFQLGGQVLRPGPCDVRISFQGHKLDVLHREVLESSIKTLHSLKLLEFEMLGPYFGLEA